jgi:putative membrane protein
MADKPYSKFESEDLILRDQLAIDRTLLANERTLMAYLRSAVALVIAGTSIMNFSNQYWFWMTGLACIPTGVITGAIGVVRYQKMNASINLVRNNKNTRSKAGL